MSANKAVQAVKYLGKGLALILVISSITSYLISLAVGPVLFFSTSDGLTVAARHIHQIPIEIFMILPVAVPLGISLGVLFAAIWATFVVCFVFAWWSRGGFPKSLREVFTRPISAAKTNFLFLMPLLAAGLFTATILIELFQTTQGVQTGSLNFPPQTSPYLILVNLAFAPLQEEFSFRITSIGFWLGIFLLIRFRHDPKLTGSKSRIKLLLLAMLSPERAKIKLGYKNVSTDGLLHGITPLEWILILITSAAFGSAHYLLGGGWEIGKVTTATLAGLAFGIVYVAYGAYANILMHWFFNYYFTVLEMAGSAYGGAYNLIANLSGDANLFAGGAVVVVFLLYVALKTSDSLTQKVAEIGRKGI